MDKRREEVENQEEDEEREEKYITSNEDAGWLRKYQSIILIKKIIRHGSCIIIHLCVLYFEMRRLRW